MHRILSELKSFRPQFKINSGQIEVLKEPIDFYVNLHRGIRQSQKRIVWSSLYIGNGNLEDFLVESMNVQMRRYEQMRISLLLDFNRGQRQDYKRQLSSQIHFVDLITRNLQTHNLQLGLFRHPKLPTIFDTLNSSTFREIFNVHHMKWYIFDDKVILTGANLEEQYFVNRQDRYMVLHDVPEIADYLDDAQSLILQHSYNLSTVFSLHFDKTRSEPWNRKKFFKEFLQSWKIFKYSYEDEVPKKEDDEEEEAEKQAQNEENTEQINKPSTPNEEDNTKESLSQDEITKYYQQDLIIQQKLEERKEQATSLLEKSFNKGDVQNIITRIEKTLYKGSQFEIEDGEDAYILLTLNIPYIKTEEDKKVLTTILKHLNTDIVKEIIWASGYMNFTDQIINFVNNCKNNIKLITASPKANGFYKAGRVKGFIPYLYRVYESKLDAQIYEYNRTGWTFHAKGLWAEFKDDSFLTVIGSSNYSRRSDERDNEIQCYIFSKCPELKEKLQKERENLIQKSVLVDKNIIQNDKDVKLSLPVKILAKLFRSYL